MDIISQGVPSLAKRVAWRQCRARAIVEALVIARRACMHGFVSMLASTRA
jgi:hypothetical protein